MREGRSRQPSGKAFSIARQALRRVDTESFPREVHPMREATSESEKVDVLSPRELSRLDAYWRAADHLSVRPIYFVYKAPPWDPLKTEHIKPPLLGHWGTTPGLN